MQFLNQQLPQNKRRGWPDMMPEEEQGSFGSHEFTCEVRNLLSHIMHGCTLAACLG